MSMTTLWVMINLLPYLYIHDLAWPEAPYLVSISALSRRKLFATLGVSLLSSDLSPLTYNRRADSLFLDHIRAAPPSLLENRAIFFPRASILSTLQQILKRFPTQLS